MRASAHLAVARSPSGSAARARITRLHSEPPLVLRPTNPIGPEPLARWRLPELKPARVSLVAGAAGPIGGDELRLEVDVGRGAALVLRSVAATIVLPGPDRRPSRGEAHVRVAEDGVLVWLPCPVIAARGCDHHSVIRITLEPGARLLLREELVLGRYGERPGVIRQRLRVCLGALPLHDQELGIGDGTAGWDSSAVMGGRRAVGSVLVVDPELSHPLARPAALPADTALLRLSGPAAVATALAKDTSALRRKLDAGLAEIEGASS